MNNVDISENLHINNYKAESGLNQIPFKKIYKIYNTPMEAIDKLPPNAAGIIKVPLIMLSKLHEVKNEFDKRSDTISSSSPTDCAVIDLTSSCAVENFNQIERNLSKLNSSGGLMVTTCSSITSCTTPIYRRTRITRSTSKVPLLSCLESESTVSSILNQSANPALSAASKTTAFAKTVSVKNAPTRVESIVSPISTPAFVGNNHELAKGSTAPLMTQVACCTAVSSGETREQSQSVNSEAASLTRTKGVLSSESRKTMFVSPPLATSRNSLVSFKVNAPFTQKITEFINRKVTTSAANRHKSAFFSDKLEDFLKNSSELRVSYDIPQSNSVVSSLDDSSVTYGKHSLCAKSKIDARISISSEGNKIVTFASVKEKLEQRMKQSLRLRCANKEIITPNSLSGGLSSTQSNPVTATIANVSTSSLDAAKSNQNSNLTDVLSPVQPEIVSEKQFETNLVVKLGPKLDLVENKVRDSCEVIAKHPLRMDSKEKRELSENPEINETHCITEKNLDAQRSIENSRCCITQTHSSGSDKNQESNQSSLKTRSKSSINSVDKNSKSSDNRTAKSSAADVSVTGQRHGCVGDDNASLTGLNTNTSVNKENQLNEEKVIKYSLHKGNKQKSITNYEQTCNSVIGKGRSTFPVKSKHSAAYVKKGSKTKLNSREETNRSSLHDKTCFTDFGSRAINLSPTVRSRYQNSRKKINKSNIKLRSNFQTRRGCQSLRTPERKIVLTSRKFKKRRRADSKDQKISKVKKKNSLVEQTVQNRKNSYKLERKSNQFVPSQNEVVHKLSYPAHVVKTSSVDLDENKDVEKRASSEEELDAKNSPVRSLTSKENTQRVRLLSETLSDFPPLLESPDKSSNCNNAEIEMPVLRPTETEKPVLTPTGEKSDDKMKRTARKSCTSWSVWNTKRLQRRTNQLGRLLQSAEEFLSKNSKTTPTYLVEQRQNSCYLAGGKKQSGNTNNADIQSEVVTIDKLDFVCFETSENLEDFSELQKSIRSVPPNLEDIPSGKESSNNITEPKDQSRKEFVSSNNDVAKNNCCRNNAITQSEVVTIDKLDFVCFETSENLQDFTELQKSIRSVPPNLEDSPSGKESSNNITEPKDQSRKAFLSTNDDDIAKSSGCKNNAFEEGTGIIQPEVVTIDKLDFLCFETSVDLEEYTEFQNRIRHVPSIPQDNTSTESSNITDPEDRLQKEFLPTKTGDITKIKGWREKFVVEDGTGIINRLTFSRETAEASGSITIHEDITSVYRGRVSTKERPTPSLKSTASSWSTHGRSTPALNVDGQVNINTDYLYETSLKSQQLASGENQSNFESETSQPLSLGINTSSANIKPSHVSPEMRTLSDNILTETSQQLSSSAYINPSISAWDSEESTKTSNKVKSDALWAWLNDAPKPNKPLHENTGDDKPQLVVLEETQLTEAPQLLSPDVPITASHSIDNLDIGAISPEPTQEEEETVPRSTYNSAFVSDKLDEFLQKNSKLKISFDFPRSETLMGLRKVDINDNSLAKNIRSKRSAEHRKKSREIEAEHIPKSVGALTEHRKEVPSFRTWRTKEFITDVPKRPVNNDVLKSIDPNRPRWALAELTKRDIARALAALDKQKYQLQYFRNSDLILPLPDLPLYPRVPKRILIFPLLTSFEASAAMSAFARICSIKPQESSEVEFPIHESFEKSTSPESCYMEDISVTDDVNKVLSEYVVVHESSLPKYPVNEQTKCGKPYCVLGCVCDSLSEGKRKRAHCGKPDCIFECSCNRLTPENQFSPYIRRPRETKLPSKLKDTVFSWGSSTERLVDPGWNEPVYTVRKRKQADVGPVSSFDSNVFGVARVFKSPTYPLSKVSINKKMVDRKAFKAPPDNHLKYVSQGKKRKTESQRSNANDCKSKRTNTPVTADQLEGEPFCHMTGGFQKLADQPGIALRNEGSSVEDKQYKIRIAKGIIERLKLSGKGVQGSSQNSNQFAFSLARLTAKVKQLATEMTINKENGKIAQQSNVLASLQSVLKTQQSSRATVTSKVVHEIAHSKQNPLPTINMSTSPSSRGAIPFMKSILPHTAEASVKIPVVVPNGPIYPVGTVKKPGTHGEVHFGFYAMPGISTHLLLGPLKCSPTNGLQVVTGVSHDTVEVRDSNTSNVSRLMMPSRNMAFVPVQRKGRLQPGLNVTTQRSLSSLPVTTIKMCSLPRVGNGFEKTNDSSLNNASTSESVPTKSVSSILENILQQDDLQIDGITALAVPFPVQQPLITLGNNAKDSINILRNNSIPVQQPFNRLIKIPIPLQETANPLRQNQISIPQRIQIQNTSQQPVTPLRQSPYPSQQPHNRLGQSLVNIQQQVNILKQPVISAQHPISQSNQTLIFEQKLNKTNVSAMPNRMLNQKKTTSQQSVISATSAGRDRSLNMIVHNETLQTGSNNSNTELPIRSNLQRGGCHKDVRRRNIKTHKRSSQEQNKLFALLVRVIGKRPVHLTRYAILKQALDTIKEMEQKTVELNDTRQAQLKKRCNLFKVYKNLVQDASPHVQQLCNINLTAGLQECYRRRLKKVQENVPVANTRVVQLDTSEFGSDSEDYPEMSAIGAITNNPFPVTLVRSDGAEILISSDDRSTELYSSDVDVGIDESSDNKENQIGIDVDAGDIVIISSDEESEAISAGLEINVSTSSEIEILDPVDEELISPEGTDNTFPMIIDCNTISEDLFDDMMV